MTDGFAPELACFLGVFVVVGRGRKGALDELRRSSGELVRMLGGSAVTQMPPL